MIVAITEQLDTAIAKQIAATPRVPPRRLIVS